MNKNLGLITLCGFILIGCAAPSNTTSPPNSPDQTVVNQENLGQTLPITANFTVNNNLIELEVAKTPEQQAMGLMYRTSLADNRGMLFPFSPPRVTRFWMKNTLIPLDMLFLRNEVVQAIESNVPPCEKDPCPIYGPEVEIDQVIELRAGRAAELNLKTGDTIKIDFLKPK